MEKETKNDPENYYEMSKPFEDSDSANKALKDFYEDLRELRKKHRIRDLLVVTYGSVMYPDGQSDFMNHSEYGNSINHLPMAAVVYGQLKAENVERINNLISGNLKNTK